MKKAKLILWLVVSLGCLTCSRQPQKNAVISFTNPQVLVKTITSNYLVYPRWDATGEEIIFNGRLNGDAWDGIYTFSARGGQAKKVAQATEDLLFPAFSADRRQIVYARGTARQICVQDLTTNQVTQLPVYGNLPTLLPDGQTVLYSGVIDNNLKLFRIGDNQFKMLTESYVSGNHCPILAPDRATVVWFEKQRQGTTNLNRIRLDSLRIENLYQCTEALLNLSLSPSGQWAIVSRANGEPFGFELNNKQQASIMIKPDTLVPNVKLLAQNVAWSPTGSQVVYVGNQTDLFSSRNPYFRREVFIGDLVVADLVCDAIPESEIKQSPPAQNISYFPLVSRQTIPPASSGMPLPVNNPPKIISTPIETVMEGDLYIYNVEAVEIDLFDRLSYALSAGPPNAEMLEKSGIVFWLPSAPGTFDFTVFVQDDKNASDSQTYQVTVLPKHQWRQASYQPPAQPTQPKHFSAGLRFLDSDNDHYLTAGENAQLQIDLKLLGKTPADSVRVQLLNSAGANEIAWQDTVIFPNCVPGSWRRRTIDLQGLPGLQNRALTIRGIIESPLGIQMLPATLSVNCINPAVK